MNIVLLSGGSGKRLWPLSNDIRSKQFIKIFKCPDGSYESMVQRVYRQIKQVDKGATVTIATSKTQVSAIHNQLGEEVGISVEPCRRDTFPAIALATAYLADVQGVDPEEPVVVCPVDPYVEDDYFEALKALSEQAAKSEANLVLMGIEPTYPSEKYGYIIPKNSSAVSDVATFKEKPDAETAKAYIAQGALWNGGVFAYKLRYVLDKAHELIDFTDYKDLFDKYAELNKISFDYAVVEKEPKIQVMRFAGQWKDLGTWNTLTEAMGEPSVGKAMMNDTCTNVHVVNELNVPVLAMGFKAASTLDSMVGYLDEKYRDIGWSSAKLDDVWNYLPARLTGCLLSLGAALCGLDGKSAFRIMRRDHRNHKSPNCAWSEAAAAGALHVQLGGTHLYFGKPVAKPTIGDDLRAPKREDIRASVRMMYAASGLMLALQTMLVWVAGVLG